MPDRVRNALLLAGSGVLVALAVASGLVTLADEVGWPVINRTLEVAGLVLLIVLSLLAHTLTIRALIREMRRADSLEVRAVRWERDFVALYRQMASTFQAMTTVMDDSEKLDRIGLELQAANERMDQVIAGYDSRLPVDLQPQKSR